MLAPEVAQIIVECIKFAGSLGVVWLSHTLASSSKRATPKFPRRKSRGSKPDVGEASSSRSGKARRARSAQRSGP